MILAGIDYSLSSPAMATYSGQDETSLSSYNFLLLSKEKKKMEDLELMNFNLTGKELPDLVKVNQQYRYDFISDVFINEIIVKKIDTVFIEDYSMGSKGRVFHIAENTELLKYKLYKLGVELYTVAPTAVKKFATGKGNAKKLGMYESFISTTGKDFKISLDSDIKSPYSDVVDAFWICKYGITTMACLDKVQNMKLT